MAKVEIDGMICVPKTNGFDDDDKANKEEEKESPRKRECPNDPRFQQQNKAKWCYTMFVDFHRCSHYFDAAHKYCQRFEDCYKILCPKSWVETWEDQIQKGTFPRDLTRENGRW